LVRTGVSCLGCIENTVDADLAEDAVLGDADEVVPAASQQSALRT